MKTKQIRRWRKWCDSCKRHPHGGVLCELDPPTKHGKWCCLSDRIEGKDYRGCLGRFAG